MFYDFIDANTDGRHILNLVRRLYNILNVVKRPQDIDNYTHVISLIVCGDIAKMYHVVAILPIDQHVHRFLWRNMETERDPDI